MTMKPIEMSEAERILPHLRANDLWALLNHALVLGHELRKAGLIAEADGTEAILLNIRGRGTDAHGTTEQ
jgi:hypothetical protein